jgi:lipoate---protein ligase
MAALLAGGRYARPCGDGKPKRKPKKRLDAAGGTGYGRGMLIVHSRHDDPWRNLATEAALLDRATRREPLLFLYVNRAAVVVGKNQNPWRECRVDRLKQEGIPLLRRVSGGGAVYHDPGNLNFALVMPRALFDRERQFELVLAALRSVGVAAERSGAHSLAAGGGKISGNAFCFRRGAALHHGTLLVSSDLQRLEQLLTPVFQSLETRAVASRPSAVVNLAEVAPGLTVERVADALIEAVGCGAGTSARPISETELVGEDWRAYADEMRGWAWTYGLTPTFELEWDVPLAPGRWRIRLRVEAGRVADVRATGPGVDEADVGRNLKDCRFTATDMAERIRQAKPSTDPDGTNALADWIERLAF